MLLRVKLRILLIQMYLYLSNFRNDKNIFGVCKNKNPGETGYEPYIDLIMLWCPAWWRQAQGAMDNVFSVGERLLSPLLSLPPSGHLPRQGEPLSCHLFVVVIVHSTTRFPLATWKNIIFTLSRTLQRRGYRRFFPRWVNWFCLLELFVFS